MKHTIVWVTALFLVLGFMPVLAQEDASGADEMSPTASVNSILIKKMEWVLSDMMRCIEELRRIKDVSSKRMLVEQMEEILWNEVEFPLLYQQTDNADSLDVTTIGTTSDVVDSGEANPLAPLYAEAFALMGIAKGYEGYSAAATDYIERAKEIYRDVLSLTVRIDSFQDPATLSQWMADARGRWGATASVRITFFGKSVAQEVVEEMSLQTVRFQTGSATDKLMGYHLDVAKRDFLRGMRRSIVTDDPLTKQRINFFSLYLPPGSYQISMGDTREFGNEITVQTNPNRNQYLIETLEGGVAVYPVPNVRELGKLLKEQGEEEENLAPLNVEEDESVFGDEEDESIYGIEEDESVYGEEIGSDSLPESQTEEEAPVQEAPEQEEYEVEIPLDEEEPTGGTE